MEYEKEVYHTFLLRIMEKYYPDIAENVLREGVFAPLTGRHVAMRTNELLSLYMLLCDLFGKELKLHDVYSFWSVDAIAVLLMEYEDDNIRSVIQRELTI